ncbi:MAG: hypothetical protein O3C43_05800 [Verrucomicrobia bacterium]|nr:hypothetical protein [Verrucomicrobiota bacterium]MDA1065998.1 hypothetical protein [Verrucomicrobiota bacterium]
MSPDPENAFFADGVQEDILTNLSKIEKLLVISRTSTLGYKGTTKKLKEIGEELGVRYLVEGSVRRAGNQVLVTAQLIDTQTDAHLWAEQYNRSLDDIFAIQAEVAKAIARQLKAAILPEEIVKIEYRPTENQQAYDAFVQARLQSGEEAINLLEKSVVLDPQFAEAWALLARERCRLWAFQRRRNDSKLLAEAHFAFELAKRFGPELPDIPWVKSCFEELENLDWKAETDSLLEALVIDPGFHPARRDLAFRYILVGRFSDAQFHLESIIRSDPLDSATNERLMDIYAHRGLWEKADELIQLNLNRSDDKASWQMRQANTHYLQSGNKEAYIRAMEEIPEFIDEPGGLAWKAVVARDFQNALLHLEEMDSSSSESSKRFQLNIRSAGLYLMPHHLLSAILWRELDDEVKSRDELSKAKTYLESSIEKSPLVGLDFYSNLMISYALEGNREEFFAISKQVEERISNQAEYRRGHQPYHYVYRAMGLLLLGDEEAAIDDLIVASKFKGLIFLNRELDLWFIFDRLRGNPRFDKLLED